VGHGDRRRGGWGSVMVRAIALGALVVLVAACGAPSLSFLDDARDAGTTGAGGATGAGGDSPFDGSAVQDGSMGEALAPDAPGLDADNPDAHRILCTNSVLDGDESDVDCGGNACPRCTIGAHCGQDADCIGVYCKLGVCAQGSCVDKVKNLKETDVDCGGGDCPPCGIGSSCVMDVDCSAQSCIVSKCQSLTCDDHYRGPAETDVDCGGPACASCDDGKKCLVPRDCASGICGSDQVCAVPTCSDGVQNGSETARDCGGSCAQCDDGMGCVVRTDCTSDVCSSRTCQAPTCTDRVKNQDESDVDCGGSCPKCGTGATCGVDADCAAGNCAGTCQPCPAGMVSVTSAAGPYCIDALEVTIGAYSAFLMSNPPLSLMAPSCAGKTSYAPSNNLNLARPTYPVTYVDWCDAFAYCASVGRHLCGRIGRGVALSAAEVTDATKSEWHNACSRSGVRAYPYGNNYVQNICVDNQIGVVGPVGASPNCVGGFTGLRDMSGNVQEWEDNCVPGIGSGLQDRCTTRGGGYNDGATAVICNATKSLRRRSQSDDATGFRCCR
jgi:hypothetical protein